MRPAVFAALALALALPALTAAKAPVARPPAAAAKTPAPADGMFLGDPRAKVLVEEYASLSCSHCAAFNNEVFPAFKKKYIDTGKVRYELHELLTPPELIAAAAFITARCSGPGHYFTVVDSFFHRQPALYAAMQAETDRAHTAFKTCGRDESCQKDVQNKYDEAVNLAVHTTLVAAARDGSLDEAKVHSCVADKGQQTALQARLAAANARGVDSTPTFFINGAKIEGEATLAQLDAAVAKAAAKKK